MPTYRSITLSLVSQFDILTIPEFAPPATPNDPFCNAPTLINPDRSLVSVYVPTYPASQFWLSYSISPPHPPKLLYYFKLYINGNLIVSWGCGEDDAYKGKTMFGLYDSVQGRGCIRQELIERRVLCFSPEAAETRSNSGDNFQDVMEIKVFRSNGRMRISPDIQEFQSSPGVQHIDKKGVSPKTAAGINLVSAGFLSDKNPKRFYKYALLDPLDSPFATFRYYYRTWDQLDALGVISPPPSDNSSSLRSQTPLPQSLPRQGSSDTLDSLASLVASYENLTAKDVMQPGKVSMKDNVNTITKAETVAEIAQNKIQPGSPTDMENISPLKVPRMNPLRLNRPPTPPPSFVPRKTLAQAPPTIPAGLAATDPAYHALTPKESFASLIRTSLSSPDPSAFRLRNPSDEDIPRPPSPPRARSISMGALKNVVASAKIKRGLRRPNEVSGLTGGSGVKSNSLQDLTRDLTLQGSFDRKDRLLAAQSEGKRKAKEGKLSTNQLDSQDEDEAESEDNRSKWQQVENTDQKPKRRFMWEKV